MRWLALAWIHYP